ncbi:MAG: DNA polymerase III subunit gamma/tau [Phycisphaerales bacterium]|nr:DNA polymerase III subunit gamma/tau [Phycisphaerales bacterium]
MSYTVLARRYRSQTFDDVVGQEPIAKTLRNAIDAGRTAHAYLFSGTRGVGKTSMARIFARELNTSDSLKEREEIGNAILRGEDLDVIEIDGASNRGVQEARDLIAGAGLAPTRCTYRIYIIDEVHMLTTPAFNALLKTMEEPPSHVKFILCTTEPHKIPATIQSRCQRFDFRSIPSVQIAKHLSLILEKEGIHAEPEVIANVARLGNGSMRDALSILDRLLAGGATTIATDEMEELLGLPSQTAVAAICDAIVGDEISTALEASAELLAGGVALDRALEEIATCFRHTLISRVCGEHSPLLDLSDSSKSVTHARSKRIDESTLTHCIAICDAVSRQVRRGGSGRALFDATIARLCMSNELVTASEVLNKTNHLPRTQVKKKSSAPVTPLKTQVRGQQTPTVTIPPTTLEWTQLQQKLSETPGLKRIASYLRCISIHEQTIRLAITEEGRDSSTYILGRRAEIERVCTEVAARTCSVHIEGEKQERVTRTTTIDPEVAASEIVRTAAELFDGTVLRVEDSQKNPEIEKQEGSS